MSAPLPLATIFLSFKNVLCHEETHAPRSIERYAACSEKFGHKPKYLPLEEAIAIASLADDDAVNALCDLIKRIISAAFSVQVVIISNLRIGLTVEDLKTKVFIGSGFENYIVGSTPNLGNREKEIASWLRAHPMNQKGIQILLAYPDSFYAQGATHYKIKTDTGLFLKTHVESFLKIPNFTGRHRLESTSSQSTSLPQEQEPPHEDSSDQLPRSATLESEPLEKPSRPPIAECLDT